MAEDWVELFVFYKSGRPKAPKWTLKHLWNFSNKKVTNKTL